MSEKMNQSPQTKIILLVSVIAAVLALSLIIVLSNPFLTEDAEKNLLSGAYWVCSGMTCTRYLSVDEWKERYCYVQDGLDTCIIRTQQGNIIAPLQKINTSSINECAEFTCIQEVLVRNASYIIPADSGV